MMGTRECVQRGCYVNSANSTVQLPDPTTEVFVEDKSILQQPPPLRFNKTDINVINVDPIQVLITTYLYISFDSSGKGKYFIIKIVIKIIILFSYYH